MNNEETKIMQPQNNKVEEKQTVVNKEEKKEGSTAARAAVIAGAGVFGGAVGGAGSVAAATVLGTVDAEEVETVEAIETPGAETHDEPQQNVEPEEDVVTAVEASANEEDYTGMQDADPVVNTPVSSDAEPEIQILGVYENEAGQEAVVLTDGEDVAVVEDLNGDGVADVLAVDLNHNDVIDANEIADISDQGIEMSQYEDAYLAQQQMEIEQHETFAYNADDQQDFNNDVDTYDA